MLANFAALVAALMGAVVVAVAALSLWAIDQYLSMSYQSSSPVCSCQMGEGQKLCWRRKQDNKDFFQISYGQDEAREKPHFFLLPLSMAKSLDGGVRNNETFQIDGSRRPGCGGNNTTKHFNWRFIHKLSDKWWSDGRHAALYIFSVKNKYTLIL